MNRYTEIADELIGRIRAGKLAVGALLPGELQLMEDFSASRHTIREALRRLEELGLIDRRRGLGTRVLARKPRRAYVHRVASPEQLLRYPPESRLDVAETTNVVAGAELAELLGCRRAGPLGPRPGGPPDGPRVAAHLSNGRVPVAEVRRNRATHRARP